MKDQSKTKQVLIQELASLRQRVAILEQRNKEYSFLAENMTDMAFMVDMDLATTYVSPSIERILGYSPDERITQKVDEQLTPKSQKFVFETLAVELEREKLKDGTDQNRSRTLDLEYYHKDGSVKYLETYIRGNRDSEGNLTGFYGLARDITERRRAEEALRESEENYRVLFESINDAVFVHELDEEGLPGRFLQVNDVACRRLGYTKEELLSFTPRDITMSEEFERIADKRIGLASQGNILAETIHVTKDGRKIPVESNIRKFHYFNRKAAISISRDITDRKRAEEALRESEERYRRLIENTPEVIYSLSAEDGTITSLNPAFESITGWSRAEWLGKPFMSLMHPDDLGLAAETFQQVLRGEIIQPYELRILSRSGKYISGEFTSVPNIEKGKVIGEFGIARDITDRKRADAALKQSEERYRLLVEKANEAIYVAQDGMLKFVNRAGVEIAGYSEKELISRPFIEFIHPDDRAMAGERHQRRLKGEEFESRHTFRFIAKNGDIKWIESGAALIDFEGRPATLNLVTDITDRKRTQEALRESETRYRLLAENAMDVIWTVDIEDMRLTYVSPSVTRLLGFTVEEAMARTMQQAYVPEAFEKAMQMLAEEMTIESAGHGDPTRSRMLELDLVRKDGNTVPVEGNFCFLRDPTGKAIGILSIVRDITDRKLAEEQIHASLREKEILLNEIHHRVKNNMQVISSLLDLQARSTGNPELTEKLNESKSRIRSMAMIHEKLYNSKDFTRIDLVDYVRVLSQELFQLYKINPGKIDLVIQSDGVVYMDINKTIPCGLILNELISNTLKHAFPGDRQGKLQILINETKNAEIEIIVRDNGLGLLDDVDIHQSQTLGLDLVDGLIKKQLNGQIEVRRDNGTEFRIKFPL